MKLGKIAAIASLLMFINMPISAPFNMSVKNTDLFDYWFDYYKSKKSSLEKGLNKIYPRKSEYEPIIKKYSKHLGYSNEQLMRIMIAHEYVESHGDMREISVKGAKGPRQWMPETAKYYDLKENDFVDESFDPIKSTKATMEFLVQYKYDFGSLDYALLAYNGGKNRLKKVLRECKEHGIKVNSYRDIPDYMLPKETLNYIYQIKAINAILLNPSHFGIKLNSDMVFFREYKTKKDDNIYNIAKKYKSSVKDILDYNGIKNKSKLPVNYPIKIPVFFRKA